MANIEKHLSDWILLKISIIRTKTFDQLVNEMTIECFKTNLFLSPKIRIDGIGLQIPWHFLQQKADSGTVESGIKILSAKIFQGAEERG